MILDDNEHVILEANPDRKVLFIWFFTKTLPYTAAAIFFLLAGLFFINFYNIYTTTLLIAKQAEQETTTLNNSAPTKAIDTQEQKQDKDFANPFKGIADYWIHLIILAGIFSVITQIYLHYLMKTYRYIITNRRCIFIGGIFKRVERSVPHKKITDIQRSQNIIERILGIWNIEVFTPGTASIQVGYRKARAELNFDGLINSEVVYESVARQAQQHE